MKTEIVPITKIAAHKLNEIGIVTCDKPATCESLLLKFYMLSYYIFIFIFFCLDSVVFDNTYSLIRSKKIHYSIRVLPPSEELKEQMP